MLQEEREDEEEIVKKRIADHNRVFKDYSSFVTFFKTFLEFRE